MLDHQKVVLVLISTKYNGRLLERFHLVWGFKDDNKKVGESPTYVTEMSAWCPRLHPYPRYVLCPLYDRCSTSDKLHEIDVSALCYRARPTCLGQRNLWNSKVSGLVSESQELLTYYDLPNIIDQNMSVSKQKYRSLVQQAIGGN